MFFCSSDVSDVGITHKIHDRGDDRLDNLITKEFKDTAEKRLQLVMIPKAIEQRKHNGQQGDDG